MSYTNFTADITLREDAVLTGSYVVSDVFVQHPHNYPIVTFLFKVTQGGLTGLQFYIEGSNDGTTWYRVTSSSIASGAEALSVVETTRALSGNENFMYSIEGAKRQRYRVWVKGVGTVTGSSLEIKAAGSDS